MITILKSKDRGRTVNDWLDSKHSFSRSNYDSLSDAPRFTDFGAIEVINEDVIKPGFGFEKHFHENVEIITYVLKGALEHKDNLGNSSNITPGDVQYMSAGNGLAHTERNPSSTEDVRFLQIWIIAKEKDAEPRYEQKYFESKYKKGQLKLVCSSDGRESSININQDIDIYLALLDEKEKIVYDTSPDKKIWIQVVRGEMLVDEQPVTAGDGVAITEAERVIFSRGEKAEFILLEMP